MGTYAGGLDLATFHKINNAFNKIKQYVMLLF